MCVYIYIYVYNLSCIGIPYIHPIYNRLVTKSVKLLTTRHKQSLGEGAGQEKQESSALLCSSSWKAQGQVHCIDVQDLPAIACSQIQCRCQGCVGESELIAALQTLPCKHLKQERVPALWRQGS